jgi:hypothetical protein
MLEAGNVVVVVNWGSGLPAAIGRARVPVTYRNRR